MLVGPYNFLCDVFGSASNTAYSQEDVIVKEISGQFLKSTTDSNYFHYFSSIYHFLPQEIEQTVTEVILGKA